MTNGRPVASGVSGDARAVGPMRFTRVTMGGWAVGFVLGIAFIVGVESAGILNTQFPVALGMGVGVGAWQSRVLGPLVGRRRAWLTATAVGLALPFIVCDAAKLVPLHLPYSLTGYVAIGGLTAGILQMRLLRRVSPNAPMWIVTSTVGWSLAVSTVLFNETVLPRIPGLRGLAGAALYVIVIMLGGVVLGAVESAGLAHLLAGRRR
jgi:hypothetical protein